MRGVDTLQLLPFGGTWETVGSDRMAGIVPEGISCDSDEWGPRSFSCTLRRRSGLWPDLGAFTPLRYFRDGRLRWGGYIWDTPNRTDVNAGDAWTLNARGWQFHLDDDLVNRRYVHTRLADYQNLTSYIAQDLGRVGVAAGDPTVGDGVIVVGWPQGAVLGAAGVTNPYSGVFLDLGVDTTAATVIVTYRRASPVAPGAGVYIFQVKGMDSPSINAAGEAAVSVDLNGVATTDVTTAWTFTTPRRFIQAFLYEQAAGVITTGLDVLVQVSALKCYANDAYRAGVDTVLKADQVIKDVKARALPRLQADDSGIAAASFIIPEYVTGGYQTPRQIIAAVNAYQNWQPKVDSDRRLSYTARPTAPTIETNADLEDAAANSGEEIYNRVITDGFGPDGQTVTVSRTSGDQPGALFDLPAAAQPTNPGFEVDTSGWTVTAGTLTRDAAVADNSAASGRMTANVSGGFRVYTTITGLTPGRQHVFRARVRKTAAMNVLGFGFQVREAVPSGAAIGSGAQYGLLVTGTFVTIDVAYTPAGNTVWLDLNANGTASTDLGYLDTFVALLPSTTLADRRGFTRAVVMPTRTAQTTAGATQLGDIFQADHIRTPSKGSCVVKAGDASRVLGGATVEPSELLDLPGQLLRFRRLRDPDTGASHRDERVVAVSYNADADEASVSLNSERGDFQALLERHAVITGQVS